MLGLSASAVGMVSKEKVRLESNAINLEIKVGKEAMLNMRCSVAPHKFPTN